MYTGINLCNLLLLVTDVDVQDHTVISVTWRAVDYNSGIQYCEWAIGMYISQVHVSNYRIYASSSICFNLNSQSLL